MKNQSPSLQEAVAMLVAVAHPKTGRKKNLQMPGEPHYQPKDLQPYLGYDQRVSWQILVSWFWMVTLAKSGMMPSSTSKLLTSKLLKTMLLNITTSKVRALERKKTNHDVLALLELMRGCMPVKLRPYLHLGLTSYDVVATAYALQFQQTFTGVFYPRACQLDALWRKHIVQSAEILQMGRTHLQDALPITAGFWLATRHNRFVASVNQARFLAHQMPGKFSGAVGTKAAIRALAQGQDLEQAALDILELPASQISTQIVQPESMERYFHEFKLTSGVLAQMGEDVRHLQASAIGEVTSISSTSSTMSHKGTNPIAAENVAGMHRSVIGEFVKIMLNSQSDLQRDLRDSNVMRSYAAVIVFVYQQLSTVERLFKSFKVDEQKCTENFWVNGRLVPAELLHLSLQRAGFPGAHTFINKVIVPKARNTGRTLHDEMEVYLRQHPRSKSLHKAWQGVPVDIREILQNADQYIGQAVEAAMAEGANTLEIL